MTALTVGAFALALASGGASHVAAPAGIQVADMGMGADGPQLGGSGDDMVLSDPGHVPSDSGMITSDPGHVPGEAGMVVDDPGHVPADSGMVVSDPGFVPHEAQMDLGVPQDDDRQDDITQ